MTGCRHCFVSGRVQGVFFRAETGQQARGLGLTGWVRNVPAGRVEVMACGKPTDVEHLCAWLWHGPDFAEVTDVTCEPADDQGLDRFEVR